MVSSRAPQQKAELHTSYHNEALRRTELCAKFGKQVVSPFSEGGERNFHEPAAIFRDHAAENWNRLEPFPMDAIMNLNQSNAIVELLKVAMMRANIQSILQMIDALSESDRELFEQYMAARNDAEWKKHVESARLEAGRRGIDQNQIDEAVRKIRYGS